VRLPSFLNASHAHDSTSSKPSPKRAPVRSSRPHFGRATPLWASTYVDSALLIIWMMQAATAAILSADAVSPSPMSHCASARASAAHPLGLLRPARQPTSVKQLLGVHESTPRNPTFRQRPPCQCRAAPGSASLNALDRGENVTSRRSASSVDPRESAIALGPEDAQDVGSFDPMRSSSAKRRSPWSGKSNRSLDTVG
jgi:hypothetical protein